MITSSDSLNTVDLGKYFAILPSASDHTVENYCASHGGTSVPAGFAYSSGTNIRFLSVEELKELVKEHSA